MLAVSHHVSEKEVETGRMVEGYLCPKNQKTCQDKNNNIKMDLKDYFFALKTIVYLSMTL